MSFDLVYIKCILMSGMDAELSLGIAQFSLYEVEYKNI